MAIVKDLTKGGHMPFKAKKFDPSQVMIQTVESIRESKFDFENNNKSTLMRYNSLIRLDHS